MINSKIIALLKLFSKEEWILFDKFVRSPYFNSRPELIPFMEYLQAYAPDFPEENIARSTIISKIPLPEGNPEKQLAYLMNYLLKLAEKFIGQQQYESQESKVYFDILNALINRKLDKHYQFFLKKVTQTLKEGYPTGSDYFLLQYELANIADRNFIAKDERRFDKHVQQVADNLDLFYISRKLKVTCEMINRERIFQTPYQLNHLKELLELSQNSSLISTPYITCYQHILKMQQNDNADDNFKAVKTLFEKQIDTFSKIDQNDLLSHILNYCIQQIRLRPEKQYFMEEALQLYLLGIEKGVLLEQGILSPWHFKNIISLFTNLKKFKKAEQFIIENTSKLDISIRKNTMHYNLATLNYNLKAYDIAISHLQKVKFTDIHYHLTSRLLLIQIYYEKNEAEPLRSLLASFTTFLNRNKNISTELRKTYLNFCKILKAILRRNPNRINAIKEKIQKYSPLAGRQWLKEMIEKEG